MELLLGCGNNREKRLHLVDELPVWSDLVTLDIDPDCKPDVIADAGKDLPFADNTFDAIHCYHVLEHLGQQGDYGAFFSQFDEYARITKIGGHFFGICPSYKSPWAWGDPGHTRIIQSHTLTYLDRECYNQIGTTTMTDYRPIFKSDWKIVDYTENDSELVFVLLLRGK